MSTIEDRGIEGLETVRALGPSFAARAAAHDAEDTFVAENYAELKRHKLFSLGVPSELGGGGATHPELCELLRELAHHCSATALALSMHQHLIATNVWNYRHGRPGKALLRRVAQEELVLVSSGAGDWLGSNGQAEKVAGGYRVTAKKSFASGCPAGDLLVTSTRYDDPQDGKTVLHFGVPFQAEGVSILENWRALGMRATGSHTVVLDGVFIPDGSISLKRPGGAWHPLWSVVLTVALPLIMAVYVGVAEAAARSVTTRAAKRRDDLSAHYLLGELENALVTAQMAYRELVAGANDYDFEPVIGRANAALIRKTIAAGACLEVGEKALEALGGFGFLREVGLERLLRDLHGAQFHPLPEKSQQRLSGRLALGLEPEAA